MEHSITPPTADPLRHLAAAERACVRRYVRMLAEQLATADAGVVEVWLYGSAARGDMWGPHAPFHSDVDLLVVTERPVPDSVRDALVNATYPLFLECGRQLSPQFWTATRFAAPDTERAQMFAAQVRADGRRLHPDVGRTEVSTEADEQTP